MVTLSRAVEFSTSLRYAKAGLSDAENHARFGDRARQHGHNYRLELTVCGAVDPVTGMVTDLKDIQAVLDREVMDRFDHRDLNCDTPFFEKLVPSPENFVRVLRELLVAALPPEVRLARLRLQPDADTWVEWIEPEQAP